jgi:two-component system chemotaxis sensor kinase CheA
VIVEISDDGRGLDQDKILKRAVERGMIPANARLSAEQLTELVFLPGFTTADSVSDLSGRGVGLDVVRNNIHSLGGNIEVRSQAGHGTHFTIRLPLTLAILDGLGVLVGSQTYILPLTSITESMVLTPELIHRLPGGEELFQFRQEYAPLIRLRRVFGDTPGNNDVNTGIVVVVEANGRRAGLLVDDLLGQQQIVIKSLESHYRRVDGVSAATILGDGTVALILDIGGLVCAVSVPALNLSSIQPAAVNRPTSQSSSPVRALH